MKIILNIVGVLLFLPGLIFFLQGGLFPFTTLGKVSEKMDVCGAQAHAYPFFPVFRCPQI